MAWLWTFGRVPELEARKLHEVSKRVVNVPQAQRRAPHVPQIIDVRTQGEFVAGHIAGARNASFLPPWDFPNRVKPLLEGLPRDTEIYVICLSAHRSIGAYKWLHKEGYSNVKQLQGGMQAWRKEGLPEVAEGSGDGAGGNKGAGADAGAATGGAAATTVAGDGEQGPPQAARGTGDGA